MFGPIYFSTRRRKKFVHFRSPISTNATISVYFFLSFFLLVRPKCEREKQTKLKQKWMGHVKGLFLIVAHKSCVKKRAVISLSHLNLAFIIDGHARTIIIIIKQSSRNSQALGNDPKILSPYYPTTIPCHIYISPRPSGHAAS